MYLYIFYIKITIRKIHFTIWKIELKLFFRNLLLSKIRKRIEIIYSHVNYTFFVHIANITCFKNHVFFYFLFVFVSNVNSNLIVKCLRKTNLTFHQIVWNQNIAFQLFNAFRIDFFHFCNIEIRLFNFTKIIFHIIIFFNEISKDENENIEQKICNSIFIFQIIKCIFRIIIYFLYKWFYDLRFEILRYIYNFRMSFYVAFKHSFAFFLHFQNKIVDRIEIIFCSNI